MRDKRSQINEIDQEIVSILSRTEDIPKFNQICRVCLCKTKEVDQQLDSSVNLLENAQEIRSLLMEATSVKILDFDFLPNHICDGCFKTLTEWYRFRSQIQNSNEILKKYLKELNTLLDSKSLPNTDITIHIQGEILNIVATQNVTQLIDDFQISILQDKSEVVGFIFYCDSCKLTFTDQISLDKHREEHCQKLQPMEENSQEQLISHLKTDIPTDHQGCQLTNDETNQSNENATEILKEIVKPENPEPDNSSSEDENEEENENDGDDISNLSKSNYEISENTKNLLDKCKVNCHVAGCKTKWSTLSEIWEHLEKDHRYGKKPYKCTECLQKFNSQRSHRLHIKKYYSFSCPVCFKIHINTSELRKHVVRTHSTDRPFKCSKCDQKFNRSGALKVHEITHSEKKQFECSICSKEFFSNNGLYLHSRSHKNIKELQCPICSKQFSSKSHLRRHIKLNTCKRKNASEEVLTDEEKEAPEQEVNINNFDIELNISAEDDSKNESTKDTDTMNSEESIELVVEVEEDFKEDAPDQSSSIFDSKNKLQFETGIPSDFEKHDIEKLQTNTNESTNQMDTDTINFEESMDIVKEEEEDFKGHAMNEPDPFSVMFDSKNKIQFETGISTYHQDFELHNVEKIQYNTNYKDVKTEISIFKDTVQDSEINNTSCEEENTDKSNDDTSILSKAQEQISESTKKLLEQCKVNCHVAGCKTKFLLLSDIIRHFKKKHLSGKKRYKCSNCLEQFKNKRLLFLHIKKYYSFKCPFCFKQTKSGNLLKTHVIETHLTEESFKCSKCDQIFNQPGALLVHVTNHCKKKKLSKESSFPNYSDQFQLIKEEGEDNSEKNTSNFNLPNTNATKVTTLKESVILENSKLDYSSSEEENSDENDDETLSKSNDQISENESMEKVMEVLDNCELNCHIPGCQTKCSTHKEMWQHFNKEHIFGIEPYTCLMCKEQFDEKSTLRLHIMRKHYSFTCPICSIIKPIRSEMKKHIKQVHYKQRRFKCFKCDQQFDRASRLESHEAYHINKHAFVCKVCSKHFFSIDELSRHSERHATLKQLKCPICKRQFSRIHYFNKHVDNNCCPKRKKIRCLENRGNALEKTKNNDGVDVVESPSELNTTVDNSNIEMANQKKTYIWNYEVVKDSEGGLLKEDSKYTLQLLNKENTDKLPHELEIGLSDTDVTEDKTEKSLLKNAVKIENPESDNESCEEEEYYDISTLKSNKPITENTKKLLDKCKLNCHITGCQTKCSSLREIWDHFRKEHILGTKPFKCSICSEEFPEMKLLRNHIKKYYKYQCPICSKIIPNNSHLRRHVIITHSNERPFKCSKCPKRCATYNNLKDHLLTHNNTKQFICSICSKGFFSFGGLFNHSKSHKVIKELQCPICGKQFPAKRNIERHIVTCVRNQKNKDLQ